jgi:hypothetical protein
MSVNTTSTMNAIFKRRYADKLERLIPEEYVLSSAISFNKKKKLGRVYHMPVVLEREHGVTYAASGDGNFTLDAPIAGQTEETEVQGSQCVIRGAIDYEALAKGAGKGDHSFEDSNDLLVENMSLSMRDRLEIALWYGRDELGTVGGVAGNVITMTTAEWASGIWTGAGGAKIEAFTAAGTAQRLGTMTITSVDIAARTVTVDAAAAGLAATDRLFFKTEHTCPGGVATPKNMVGLHAIAVNTGSLWGIDAAVYPLWKSCSLAVGGVQLSFEACQDLIALLMAKGYKGEGNLYVSPQTWAKMMTDQAALRRHGDPNKSGNYEMGAEKLTFWTQAGKLNIISSCLVKEGYGYILQPKNFTRIGATDITFNIPGRGGEFFRQQDDQAGIEIRAFYHQALFTKAPGKIGLLTGIVN